MSSQGADPDDILEQIRQREAEEKHQQDVAEKKRQRDLAMRADNRKSKKNTKKKTAVDPNEEE